MDIPVSVGGQRDDPLEADVPDLDPAYEVNSENERILKAISASLQAGQRGNTRKNAWSRAIGLYGPPGTGKNTLLRQLAASIKTVDKDGTTAQGLNYVEVNITPNMTIEQALGSVVLETDPSTGNTVSRVKLGKLGLALAMGSVVAVNEIVRNPKLATALQSALEDGEIIITSPEAGMVKVPVHPASITALTWNPGNEGDPDRPASAPLSRIIPFRLDKASPKERARRAAGFFDQFDGGQNQGDSAVDREKERQRILNDDYAIPATFRPEQEEVDAAVELVADIERLAGGNGGMSREIGRRAGLTSTAPGDRQLRSFIFLGKTVGWRAGLEVFKVCCDQDQNFNEQWNLIVERFEHHFGEDGNANLRKAKQRAASAV
jgi:MoxR-like ATPase